MAKAKNNPYASFFRALSAAGIRSETARKAFIAGYTEGQTDSLKDCTPAQIAGMIRQLAEMNAKSDPKKMRAKVLILATNVGLLAAVPRGETADFTRFNAWMKNNSTLKKELWRYSAEELPGLIDQLEAYQKDLMRRTGRNISEQEITPTPTKP